MTTDQENKAHQPQQGTGSKYSTGKRKTSLVTCQMPEKLHKETRILAATQGTSAAAIILAALDENLEEILANHTAPILRRGKLPHDPEQPAESQRKVQFHLAVPIDLHRKLRVDAVTHKTSIRAIVTAALEEKLRRSRETSPTREVEMADETTQGNGPTEPENQNQPSESTPPESDLPETELPENRGDAAHFDRTEHPNFNINTEGEGEGEEEEEPVGELKQDKKIMGAFKHDTFPCLVCKKQRNTMTEGKLATSQSGLCGSCFDAGFRLTMQIVEEKAKTPQTFVVDPNDEDARKLLPDPSRPKGTRIYNLETGEQIWPVKKHVNDLQQAMPFDSITPDSASREEPEMNEQEEEHQTQTSQEFSEEESSQESSEESSEESEESSKESSEESSEESRNPVRIQRRAIHDLQVPRKEALPHIRAQRPDKPQARPEICTGRRAHQNSRDIPGPQRRTEKAEPDLQRTGDSDGTGHHQGMRV